MGKMQVHETASIVGSYVEFWSPDHHRRIDDLTGWSSPGKRLPFTMHAGFVVPLDMLDLESMLNNLTLLSATPPRPRSAPAGRAHAGTHPV